MKTFIKNHPDLWEFIKFNVLSNVATVSNFVTLWICTTFIFQSLAQTPFQWFVFNYPVQNGGLAGFLGFLVAYIVAQIVNYIVQRLFVFGATNEISSTLHWYILTVVVAGLLSIVLPPYTTAWFMQLGVGLGAAQMLANVVNIILQVVINYPMLKFVVMKK